MSGTDTDYSDVAHALGLDQQEAVEEPSNYWLDLTGDDLAAAIVDRFTRHREWLQSNGLIKGWGLKLHYYYNEYNALANTEYPHLAVMQQYGSQDEYSYVSINQLRALTKTLIASCVQNPPTFQPLAVNADASSMESAALYKGVLDYYVRQLRLNTKLANAVEKGMVVDQSFVLVEWDPFAGEPDQPTQPAGIWAGAPAVRVLNPWDVCYDVTKPSWQDLDWVIVRDWVDREKCKAQFPEMASDIDACQSRAQVVHAQSTTEPSRYQFTGYETLSNDIQVFKLYHRNQPYMPNGKFCMVLESGKMLYESPVGLMYPKLPVERFAPEEQVDLLLGYSPMNEVIGCQEALNTIQSAITSNATNYANQYIVAPTGSEINPRTLEGGHRLLEYAPGSQPPAGLSLTAIPNVLFEHCKELEQYMQTVLGASNSARGQTGGANQSGSGMLFLASQTAQNNGALTQNYTDFAAGVMTSLLHVLRTFARTERTIQIMGKMVASKTIVLATALKDFDEVVCEMTNPVLNTAQGRLGFAQTMMQYGLADPKMAMQVATSGNLGAATDPAREVLYELQLENEWLIEAKQVLVNAMDDHQQHIAMHQRLFATPWLRLPELAEKLGMTQAPMVMQAIQNHIDEHMAHLQGNQSAQVMTTAGQQPGQPDTAKLPALGHQHGVPQPQPGAAPDNPMQAAAVATGVNMPSQPAPPAGAAPGGPAQ